MLQPKKTKFRRAQKGRMKGNAQRGNQLAFGSFGIKTKKRPGRLICVVTLGPLCPVGSLTT